MFKYFTFLFVALSAAFISYSQQYQIIRQFDDEATGFNPSATPIVVDSSYYGMTRNGGAATGGTIYRMSPDGSNYKVIHSFDRFNGVNPAGSLLFDEGWLYGMTYRSGLYDDGVIFKIRKDGSEKTLLHSFSGSADDGGGPSGSLIMVDSVLYGMTQHGGEFNKGSIFRLNKDSSDFRIIHSFDYDRDSGLVPHGDLLFYDGRLYGIAQHSVFTIKTDGSDFRILKVFTYGKADGYMTLGTPSIQGSYLFGTARFLDSVYAGTIFRINIDGDDFRIIHKFSRLDTNVGSTPTGRLKIIGSKIYGMTQRGGKHDKGVIYRLNFDGTAYQVLYDFGSIENDGYSPSDYSGLNYYRGSLFGVTTWGGTKNGVFFRYGDIALLDSCDYGSFTYTDFMDIQNLQLNGDAAGNRGAMRLCPSNDNDSGSVFYKIPVPIASNFKSEFTFSFSQGRNDFDDGSPDGADGIAFVIQGNDAKQIGKSGGGIGYSGIYNSFAIEFDAYNNGDDLAETNGSHIAVFSNGRAENSSDHHNYALRAYTDNIPLLAADSGIYYGKVEYSYEQKKLKIWLDKTGDYISPVLEIDSLDLPSMLKLVNNNKAYIGFTASTGTSYQNADLKTWSWCFNKEQIIADVFNSNETEIVLLPNPASDYIEISVPPLESGPGSVLTPAGRGQGVDGLSISIYDVLGDEVLKGIDSRFRGNDSHFPEGIIRIDVSSLSPSVYFVRIGDMVRKFVKM